MVIAVIALIVAYVTLYKTRFGLRLMACGEHPQAADSVGINVYKMRWAGVLISGALGGLGGICLHHSPASSKWKFEDGVAGFGFLALAVMIFGQWKPQTHRARGAAVRPVPRAVERILRLRLPACALRISGVGVQYAAVHHLADRARLHVQELPRPQGRGHPVRQRQPLSARANFRTPVKQDGGAFCVGCIKPALGIWHKCKKAQNLQKMLTFCVHERILSLIEQSMIEARTSSVPSLTGR